MRYQIGNGPVTDTLKDVKAQLQRYLENTIISTYQTMVVKSSNGDAYDVEVAVKLVKKPKREPGPNGPTIHPETGEVAPAGQCWVTNLMSGKYVLEQIGTPWTCSVASETYWAS